MRMQLTQLLCIVLFFVGIHQSSFASVDITPLERYEYSEWVLVGTGMKNNEWIACFQSHDKQIIVAQEGDKIGRQFGYIAEIQEKYVRIIEPFQLNLGEWYERSFNWPIAGGTRRTNGADSHSKCTE